MNSKYGDIFDMEASKEALIIKAAIKVFAKQGFHNAKISEIAKEAGVATGLIYSYFYNKLDLLLIITIDFWQQINSLIQERIIKLEDPLERIRTIVDTLEELLFKDKEGIYRSKVLHEGLPYILLGKERKLRAKRILISKGNRQFLSTLDKIIEEGQKKGKFDSSFKPAIIRQILYGSVEMLLYGLFLHISKNEDVGYSEADAREAIEKLIEKFLISEDKKDLWNDKKSALTFRS